MANKSAFQKVIHPLPNAVNAAGGAAYALSDYEALAQLCATSCFNGAYYASAADQLTHVVRLAAKVDAEFLAACAIYGRRHGRMKDAPAALVAALAARTPADVTPAQFRRVFSEVIDNGKMLRTFVQILRSGAFGRRSMGTVVRRCVREWLDGRDDADLLRDSVGTSPTIGQVIRLAHAKPGSAERATLYRWLIKGERGESPCDLLAALWAWRDGRGEGDPPALPFQLLDSLPLSPSQWASVFRRSGWHFVRMNLNTALRHGVYNEPGMVQAIADKIADAGSINAVGAMPYQLFTTFQNIDPLTPRPIVEAIGRAAEIATANSPSLPGPTLCIVDVSGSMKSPVTGVRAGATSKTSCVDVAALIAACLVRKNADCLVVPVCTQVHRVTFMPTDSVLSITRALSINGGGTALSLGLKHAKEVGFKPKSIVVVSDNQSWADQDGTLHQLFQRDFAGARMACVNLQPYPNSQAKSSPNVLNVGGFSDDVFFVLADFFAGSKESWADRVIRLASPENV